MPHPATDLLRFITAGSVDDGKSTLIGRLLYDSKALLSDQTADLIRTGTTADTGTGDEPDLDFSALTDGLEAEREQGITIDVAYRYFRSGRRRFIIADAPGHEQYTRNMVTGASTSDAAIILIDATKVRLDETGTDADLLDQTKRHSALVRLLGLPHVIVAVNKIDLLGFDPARYHAIESAYQALAARLGLKSVHILPISALRGDNVVHRSDRTPWYEGPTLLEVLETLPLDTAADLDPGHLRFPVQMVVREGGSTADSFRGYMGRVEGGRLVQGASVRVLPGGVETAIAEILTPDGPVLHADPGAVVTVRLTGEVDISRGDMLVDATAHTTPSDTLQTTVCWFDAAPLHPARRVLVRQTTALVPARVTAIGDVLDVKTLSHGDGRGDLALNDIGRVDLRLQRPIVCDPYDRNRRTGAFILIDEATNRTLGAGLIDHAA